MGGRQQLARLAGGIVGLGLAFAAAFPFKGVPPHGVSGRPVPAQVEVRALASGELLIDPVGTILPPTAFPAPGAHGGPTVAITARNLSPIPLRLSLRLTGLSPALDDAATVRGSAAGAVLVNGTLGSAARWSAPAGLLASGAQTTLRLRFKLKAGLDADAYNGRLDIRQLELKGTPVEGGAGATTPAVVPPGGTVMNTTPSTSPAGSTVASSTPVASTPTITAPPAAGH